MPEASTRRVLVVEDAFLTAESLAAMLEELGYAVAGPVPDARRARDILKSEHVDAALLDVNLRGELVTPVVDCLLELERPFAYLTAYHGLDLLPERYRNFPSVAKPCTPETLRQVLDELLEEPPSNTAGS